MFYRGIDIAGSLIGWVFFREKKEVVMLTATRFVTMPALVLLLLSGVLPAKIDPNIKANTAGMRLTEWSTDFFETGAMSVLTHRDASVPNPAAVPVAPPGWMLELTRPVGDVPPLTHRPWAGRVVAETPRTDPIPQNTASDVPAMTLTLLVAIGASALWSRR